MIQASLVNKAHLGLTLKRNRKVWQFTGQKITTVYKFCCYSHLDLPEYKSGLFTMSYFWIGETSHSIPHHAALFSKLYIQDDYHSLSSLFFIPNAAGCSTGNWSELKFTNQCVRTLHPMESRARFWWQHQEPAYSCPALLWARHQESKRLRYPRDSCGVSRPWINFYYPVSHQSAEVIMWAWQWRGEEEFLLLSTEFARSSVQLFSLWDFWWVIRKHVAG